MINYGFVKELDKSFEDVLDVVPAKLKEQGFGILTTIDVKAKLKEKLDVDFKKYIILGACNPPNAYDAIQVEENIGLMLPCNVIVYEKGDKTVVAVIRPTVAMSMIDNPELKEIARSVETRLKFAFDAIG